MRSPDVDSRGSRLGDGAVPRRQRRAAPAGGHRARFADGHGTGCVGSAAGPTAGEPPCRSRTGSDSRRPRPGGPGARANRRADSAQSASRSVQILDDAHQAGDRVYLFRRNTADVATSGMHPVTHVLLPAADQRVKAAIATEQQQGQLAGLTVGIETAGNGAAVAPDDGAERLLRQPQRAAGVQQCLCENGPRVRVGFGSKLHGVSAADRMLNLHLNKPLIAYLQQPPDAASGNVKPSDRTHSGPTAPFVRCPPGRRRATLHTGAEPTAEPSTGAKPDAFTPDGSDRGTACTATAPRLCENPRPVVLPR